MCNICNFADCDNCGEYILSNHECNPDFVETYTILKMDTRPCPRCKIRISKTEGCDDMFCTNCKAKFSWRTGEFRVDGHNPHQEEYESALAAAKLKNDPMIRARDRLRAATEEMTKILKRAKCRFAEFELLACVQKAFYESLNFQPHEDMDEMINILRNRYIAGYIDYNEFEQDLSNTVLFVEYRDMKIKLLLPILERLISTTELFSMDIVLNIHFQPKMFEVAFRRDREMYYDTLKRLDVYRIPNVNCARPYRFMFVEYYDTILNEAIVKDITHYPVNIPPVGVYTPRFGYIPIHVS